MGRWLQVTQTPLPPQLHSDGSPCPPPLLVQAPSSAHLFKVREAAFDQLPLSSPIRHPEERQRIIYLEKRKTLKVSASDRHDTFYTGTRRQERGAGFSSLWGAFTSNTHTSHPLYLQTLSNPTCLALWVFFPSRPLPTSPGGCDN